MRLAVALASLLLLAAACTPAPAATPTSAPAATAAATAQPRLVHFMAGYKPQANLPFVAVYVAQVNGYFALQGLQAAIAHASGPGEHFKVLLQCSVYVTTSSGDGLVYGRAQGMTMGDIATLCERSKRAYAVRADLDIHTMKSSE